MWVMKRMDKCGVLKTKSVNHCAFFLFVVDYRAAAPLFFFLLIHGLVVYVIARANIITLVDVVVVFLLQGEKP